MRYDLFKKFLIIVRSRDEALANLETREKVQVPEIVEFCSREIGCYILRQTK